MDLDTANALILGEITAAAESVRVAEKELIDAVVRAKWTGFSWSEIAARLGVSKQAAHERFAPYCKD